MKLYERDEPLAELNRALALARTAGRVAVIAGEAGIGKTSLLQHFAAVVPGGCEMLWGGCEALGTPRPLGPLLDIRGAIGVSTGHAFAAAAPRHELFAAVLEDLHRRTGPVVVAIDDVHWADEATLDLLQFLGRRIAQTRALLVITMREDEVGADHPVVPVLGAWPQALVHRIHLKPLSIAAVAALAGTVDDADALHRLTGGNPFFVTELVASRDAVVPASVRDAVLARRARLATETRAVIDLVSVVPSWADQTLVREVADPSGVHLDAAMAGGLLRSDGRGLTFRHELARLAVLSALPPTRVHDAHRRVLGWLLAQPDRAARLARIVHHAEAIDDVLALREHAPEAARQAASVGAHRQAVQHYQRAIRACSPIPDTAQAGLLEALAYEHYLTGDMAAARDARTRALAIDETLSDVIAIGRNLRWLSRLSWFMGRSGDAETFAERAIDVLRTQPEGEELAMAFSNRSQLHMLGWQLEGAITWGSRAIDLARQIGSVDVLTHALNNVGTARVISGDPSGWPELEESLRLALAHDFHEHAARAYTNLGANAVQLGDHIAGAKWLDEGLAYTRERDLDAWTHYMQAWRARTLTETGRWADAADDARAVLAAPHAAPVSRMVAASMLALVAVRRGEAAAGKLLADAQALAATSAEGQRLVPVLAATAESAFLAGRLDEAGAAARDGLRYASADCPLLDRDRLSYWLWKAGAMDDAGRDTVARGGMDPFVMMICGRWADAAAAWQERGCPYERGLALLEGDLPAVQAALEIFLTLGAEPAANWARQRLRQIGVTRAPRGRRPATRAHPAGLTQREVEVLEKIADGLSNPDIARRLFVSPKTVDHHVSAILAKLDVTSRDAAVALARERGWLSLK